MVCDACEGTKISSGLTLYHLVGGGLERDILAQFVSQKSGKNKTGNDFELCNECNKEYKKILSQKLKEKIIAELASKKSVDSQLLLKYGHGSNFIETDDWIAVRNQLIKNIQRYKSEWQIKEMNYNRDGKEYFHPESGQQTSQLTVLIHQSAPVEYRSNGFIIVKQPKMYLKSYFSPEQWSQIEKSLSQTSTQPPKFPVKLVFGIVLATLLVGGIITGLVYYKKRRKTKLSPSM